jgi:cell wall-associated NlpC family hydrolase
MRPMSRTSAKADQVTVRPCNRWPIHTAILAAIASAAVVLLGATPAYAEPSVAEIEKQIDQAWNQLEPTIERHNATRQDLAAKKKQAGALAKKIQPLQGQIDVAMGRVSEFAVRAYKGDNTSAINAILTTGSPTMLADQLTVLEQFARRQAADVQAVVDLKEKYAAQKAPLDKLVAQLTKTEADLATKKTQIDAEIDKLQKLRIKVYGSGGGGSLRPAPCPAAYPGGGAGVAVKFACAQIGKPYVWGAEGPNSYDCSGLMLAAWAKAGVYLPHNAAKQRQVTGNVTRANLRAGDLVFYYSDLHHVGMYVGNGWVVHASQAGVPVKMKKIDDGPINSYGRPG